MLHLLVLLTRLAVPLDDEREILINYGPDGQPLQAVIRRFDGQPMTCPTYFASFSHTYTCNGSCASPLTASATATSNFSRAEACTEARAAACASATCSSGTYQVCQLNHAYSLWNGGTGSCTYAIRLACEVSDDCPSTKNHQEDKRQ